MALSDNVKAFATQLGELHGTSPEKIDQLVRLVRSDGTASFVLGLLERVPYIKGTVRFLLYDMATLPPRECDALLETAAEFVRGLRSDPVATLIDRTGGD